MKHFKDLFPGFDIGTAMLLRKYPLLSLPSTHEPQGKAINRIWACTYYGLAKHYTLREIENLISYT